MPHCDVQGNNNGKLIWSNTLLSDLAAQKPVLNNLALTLTQDKAIC